jgi:hypothetical protein
MKINCFLIFFLFLLSIPPTFGKGDEFINFDPILFNETKKVVNIEKQSINDCYKYEEYRYRNEIRLKYLDVKWPEENQHIKLRSTKKVVSREEYKKILYRYNFYDNFANPKGCFRNKFKQQVEFSAKYKNYKTAAFLDQVTGLMWKQSKKKKMTYKEARKALDEWNNHNYGGYSDWRIPTLEEAASLYTRFGEGIRKMRIRFWIDDEYPSKERWIGSSSLGASYPVKIEKIVNGKKKIKKFRLLMVRNQSRPYPIKKEEVDPIDEQCRQWEFYHSRPDIMKKPEKPEWPKIITAIKLRSKPIHYIDKDMVNKELQETGFNFVGAGYQCFQNYYIDVDSDVIVDLATNLMWQKKSSSGLENYQKLEKQDDYINALNSNKFAGFNNWRSPTTPEIASLIEETDQRKNKSYLPDIFYADSLGYNVSDNFSFSDSNRTHTIMIAVYGTPGFFLDRNKNPLDEKIKAVRTLSKEEVTQYCQQKEVTCH